MSSTRLLRDHRHRRHLKLLSSVTAPTVILVRLRSKLRWNSHRDRFRDGRCQHWRHLYLTYTATAAVNTSTATRTVHVTDTTAPVITLNGEAAVTNECHTAYADPSASAADDCDANASVATSGTVDLNTVGVYTRTYTATDAAGNHSSTTRQITVKETIAPVITVTASPSTVECHTSYTDAGATAIDSCDAAPNVASAGSVDVNTRGDYTITYTATDATGNSSTATRTISVVDGTAPVVSLNGAATVAVECHGSFSDPGATATDTCDANPTVTPSGAIDANTPGVYILTYTAQDAAATPRVPPARSQWATAPRRSWL